MVWAEIAHQMGAIPLLWLITLTVRGKPREPQWWTLAIAFFVSWLADSAVDAHMNAWVVSVAFPVGQTALIGAVFFNPVPAMLLAVVLVVVGCLAVAVQGVSGPDVILSSVAALAVILCVWNSPQRKVRASLLVYFGLGQVAWLILAALMTTPTWYGYQACRLIGLLLFCWASWNVRPSLELRHV